MNHTSPILPTTLLQSIVRIGVWLLLGLMALTIASDYPARAANDPFPLTLIWSSIENDATNSVAWGDYDNDGDLDLVAGNAGPNRLYQNDNGILIPSAVWSSTESDDTYSVAWGDYDSDGDLDLAVGNRNQPNRLYRNDDGTLTTSAVFSTTETDNTTSVAWGDYDNDGDLDLIAGNYGESVGRPLRLYRNESGMLNPVAYWTSSQNYRTHSVAWGDVDGDGYLDLAIGNNGGPNQVYRNNTDGTLSPYWSSGDTAEARSVAWGDYDNDGDLDLVVGNFGSQQSGLPNRVYQNTGVTLNPNSVWQSSESDKTYGTAWGDYDGDGDLDLVAGNDSQPNRVYRNANGTLTPSAVWSANQLDFTLAIAWGDMDGDGDLDLAVGNVGANRVYRNEAGTLLANAALSSTESDPTTSVAWGDYDGDGDLDQAVGNYNKVNRLYQNNNGILTLSAGWLPTALYNTMNVAWGDVDSDGDLDLVVANKGQPNLLYQNNDGILTANPVWSAALTDPTTSVAWGDYDNDGDLDLAVGNRGQYNRVYGNVGGMLTTNPVWSAAMTDTTTSVAWGDVDDDGDLDLAVGNCGTSDSNPGRPNRLYRNDNGSLTPLPVWSSTESDGTYSLAWGDYDGDGDLDLAAGNGGEYRGQSNRLYRNDGGMLTPNAVWSSIENDYTRSVAWSDYDGDGDLDLAVGNYYGQPNQLYRNDNGILTTSAIWSSTETESTQSVAWGDYDGDGDLDLMAGDGGDGGSSSLYNQPNHLYHNGRDGWTLPGSVPLAFIARPGQTQNADLYSSAEILGTPIIPITYTLSNPEGKPVRIVRASFSLDGGGQWLPAIATSDTITTNLTTTATYIYKWDTFASGFFGQSDNVTFRIEAIPAITHTANSIPGPYLYGRYATSTFPFRVRGTQIRVISDTVPISNAVVYRLPAGQTVGGTLMNNNLGLPLRTNNQGYLQGRGQIGLGDQLLALVPITWTDSYTLYYTNGAPTPSGLNAFNVVAAGVQTLTVSSAHPLMLFNVHVSLEWDASHDTAYLDQLQFNLQRASEYLYDFTNGQAALGQIILEQNADSWAYAHVVVHANNRLRPFAVQGGVVITPTTDPQHSDIVYDIGQIHIGSTWNRYGLPGQSMGEDWPIVLAHELSHYLFFLDDAYLGLDENGLLVPVNTCTGTAMGDLYSDPNATEFIANQAHWDANCAGTLSHQALGRTEWNTLKTWYPALITPTFTNSGPSLMPFDFTAITAYDPLTPTTALDDPTFYIDYVNGAVSSSEARAFLLRDNYVVDLGSPMGGQNRVLARGAQPGDRLCVFDRAHAQFGCEVITLGDDHLSLEQDSAWTPVITVSPVTSQTFTLQVESLPAGLSLQARLYPEYGFGSEAIALVETGGVYSGTFNLDYPALAGHVQVWANATTLRPVTNLFHKQGGLFQTYLPVISTSGVAQSNSYGETIVAYSIGGNPGNSRGYGGGQTRGGGGNSRGYGGGNSRGYGGGGWRNGGAPLVSPDGQMIFFTSNPLPFDVGEFYTVQDMAGLPSVPPGRLIIGQGHRLVATAGAPSLDGSITFQYLSNDVLIAGMDESFLTIYFWDGNAWQALTTVRDPYYNVASAPSQGAGVYALMASVEVYLEAPGWNLIGYPIIGTHPITEALVSISGYYTTVASYRPADANDPWKIFDTTAPGWVNDLSHLEYGRGYWINVTQPITLYLGGGQTIPLASVIIPEPPTTFYGPVLASANFTPTVGMIVTAWVNGVQCGQGQTRLVGGQIVYTLNVFSDGTGSGAGCGAPGRWVTFRINGQSMTSGAAWDNRQVWELALMN